MPFSEKLLAWYDREKRTLPWRGTGDPYRIWLSEIMLQQTRAEAVMPRYDAFLKQFPTVFALAEAGEDEVLKAWEGMGYYSRARNLHRAAKSIAENGGKFPQTSKELEKLPGVGAYTSAAIASIAFGEAVPAVDGNFVRVLTRVAAWEEPVAQPQKLRPLAEEHISRDRPGDWNQAVMDLGSQICTPKNPKCGLCPLAGLCRARNEFDPMDFPKKSVPILRKESERTVYLALFQGKLLLRKRPATGLLAGLWEFPNYEGGEDDPFRSAPVLRELPGSRHVFTHLVWHMRGKLVAAPNVPEGYEAFDRAAFESLAIPSAFRVYREIAREVPNEKE